MAVLHAALPLAAQGKLDTVYIINQIIMNKTRLKVSSIFFLFWVLFGLIHLFLLYLAISSNNPFHLVLFTYQYIQIILNDRKNYVTSSLCNVHYMLWVTNKTEMKSIHLFLCAPPKTPSICLQHPWVKGRSSCISLPIRSGQASIIENKFDFK